ncbi:MAG: hypothetical protein U0R27_02130 [Candidatus Nanopelagicales bacterium]
MNEDELRSRLSALPSPPMPDDVHSAISAALASEAQARPTGGEVVALTPRHQRRLSGLLIAAAVAGVLMLPAVTVQSPTPPGGTQSPVVRAGAIYAPEDFAQQLTQRFLSAPAAAQPTNTFADSAAGIDACTDAVDAFGNVMGWTLACMTQPPLWSSSRPIRRPEYEEVWVVNPGCGTGDAVIRHMVYDVDEPTR